MKQQNFSALDLFVIDGAQYRLVSCEPGGIVLSAAEPPHPVRSITHDDLTRLLRTPGFRYIPRGATRAVSERNLGGFPEHFRDLPDDKRNIALWRREFAEELLSCYQTGLARRNEPSVAKVLQAIITAVESRLRQRRRGQCKRAGRIETNRTPPCAKTVLIWARTYEKSGFDIMSLVPTTHRCGRRERMMPGELAAFEKLLAEYATPLRPTISQIHERATNLYADFNRERAVQKLAELRVPSRSAVYRAIKRLDPYETCLQREGVDAANKKFAIVEYGVQALRPMERVEIDEWDIDLFALVSKPGLLDQLTKDEAAILQAVRLVVCVVIDCATRCIVGFTLSRSTSSEAAIRAMEMATIDKTSIAMSFGCRAGWHQGGRPETLAADQGSAFVNGDFKITCAGLLTRPINPPAGVAKLRSRIERLFGTFASHFVSRFRGRTFSDPVRRGEYASEAEASLTEQDLLGAFVTYIVDVYHQRQHAGLGGESPAQCWDRLVAKYGLPAPVDAMDRRAIFGVELERTISGRGVRVFGADFSCEALRQAYKHNHQRKLRLRFDQMDLGWIAVEVNGIWHPAYDLSGALSGVSFYQWSAFAKTVMAANREQAAMTAGIYHDGLRRLELLSVEAANAAQLGRMTLSAEELDRAERTLGLGLHFLPSDASAQAAAPSNWLEGGVEVGAPDAGDPENPSPPEAPPAGEPPMQGKGWRFDDEE